MGAEHVAWSPDGLRLAILSAKVPNDYSGSVLVMNGDGSHRRRVALLHRGQSQLRWRTAAVIQVLDDERPNKTIVSNVPLSGSGPRRVGEELQGSLSPDGRRRALVRGVWPQQDSQIYVARADGSHAVNITRSRSVGPSRLREASPSWSPDGGRIARHVSAPQFRWQGPMRVPHTQAGDVVGTHRYHGRQRPGAEVR